MEMGCQRPFSVCREQFRTLRNDARDGEGQRLIELNSLLEATLAGLGYELVELERSNRGTMLRIFIDAPAGITLDDCTRVSHHLTKMLAAEEVGYDQLEVSSPGLDRPLRKEKDFERFAGNKARIRLREPLSGRRIFTGVLGKVESGVLDLDVDGQVFGLTLANIEKARLVPQL